MAVSPTQGPTIADVANSVGVSAATVSRVINGRTNVSEAGGRAELPVVERGAVLVLRLQRSSRWG